MSYPVWNFSQYPSNISPLTRVQQYSTGGQQGNAYTSSYAPAIPQYTETQIYQYYQQYQVYPPQPYHVIPDFPQPVYGYDDMQTGSMNYTHDSLSSAPRTQDRLAIPEDHRVPRRTSSQRTDRSRSSSQPRTYKCELSDCTSTANFTRLADLQRHQATVHKAPGPPDYPCSVPECTRVGEKGFTRRDHLVEHLRNFHHIDIPKRRPGERSAYPLGLKDYTSSLS
ncbi:hypothetical protein B0J11DRAFT_249860 [Dendryphion nanum]|uniref:C2H2-type domain-containing protein n=1 Tax=Dendryphion nanum TaxID=256645 RepID=A0A9P9E412_9PLEO|nr:hypothetical protein B0J11DRAFT_249860 [Dendryphion nanum]